MGREAARADGSGERPAPRRWRRALLAAGTTVLAGGAALGVLTPRSPDDLPGLNNTAGWTHGAGPGGVLERAAAQTAAVATVSTVPALRDSAWPQVMVLAVRDLRDLQRPDGAVLAGPSGAWAYVWPRDTAFTVAAFAGLGDHDRAWQALRFLARLQSPDGGFEARYLPDGSGVPDDRAAQSDACGWVLWGMDRARALGDSPVPGDLTPMRDACLAHVLALTDSGRRLPDPSPDYWERDEADLSLGTVAPLVAGLQAGANLLAAEGFSRRSGEIDQAADRLLELALQHFGPTFERYGTHGGLDAAVTMLVPPFVTHVDGVPEPLGRAWQRYPAVASRAAGGVAPGQGWKQDGISWTPEGALVAYSAASLGRVDVAGRWLSWLAEHRTSWGSLPEKVLPDGRPAGPAPLAWTAASVILAQLAIGPAVVE